MFLKLLRHVDEWSVSNMHSFSSGFMEFDREFLLESFRVWKQAEHDINSVALRRRLRVTSFSYHLYPNVGNVSIGWNSPVTRISSPNGWFDVLAIFPRFFQTKRPVSGDTTIPIRVKTRPHRKNSGERLFRWQKGFRGIWWILTMF